MTELAEKLTVVLIDDEERSLLTLRKLIETYIENVEVLALASDVLDGLRAIQQYQPNVVFLDIEMPNYSGFKLIEHFEKVNSFSADSEEPGQFISFHFDTVFVTAYEKYAVKAHKAAAIGYLLKPVNIDDLIDIFKKIRKKRAEEKRDKKITDHLPRTTDRIIFPTQNGLIYIQGKEVCHLESSGRYTYIHLINNHNLLTTLSLKECMKKLANSTFIRIHRSFIINLAHIQNYSRGRDSFVIMDNNAKVDVGLYYKDDLNKAIAFFLR